MGILPKPVACAFIAVNLLLSANLAAQPQQILIIRHAEKPDDTKDSHLTARGYARAAALVQYFSGSFSTADFLYATQKSSGSNRPVETLTPLATALHMTINSSIADADYATLAQQILTDPQYAGKMLIVCWHHGTIPALARALGVDKPPTSWLDAVFDRVWRIQYSDGQVIFDNLPQRLLFGDSQE